MYFLLLIFLNKFEFFWKIFYANAYINLEKILEKINTMFKFLNLLINDNKIKFNKRKIIEKIIISIELINFTIFYYQVLYKYTLTLNIYYYNILILD